jgi:hypothetical protein
VIGEAAVRANIVAVGRRPCRKEFIAGDEVSAGYPPPPETPRRD